MRTCTQLKTAIERLASFLDGVTLVPTGGGRYEIEFDESPSFRGIIYRKYRTLARLTTYALEIGHTPGEVREAVKWDPGLDGLPQARYRLAVDKLLSKLGGSDTRMLLKVYGNGGAP